MKHPAVVIGAGCLCAIPAIDLAICSLRGLIKLAEIKTPPPDNGMHLPIKNLIQKIRQETIENTVKAIFLGCCAANLVPGAAVVGFLGFCIYSKITWKKEGNKEIPSYTTFFTGFGITLLWHFKVTLAKKALVGIALASKKVVHVCQQIFRGIGIGIKACGRGIRTIFHIPLKVAAGAAKGVGAVAKAIFRHPAATAAVILGTACIVAVVVLAPSGTAAAVGFAVGKVLSGAWAVIRYIPHLAITIITTVGKLLINSVGPACQAIGWTLKTIVQIVLFIPAAIVKILSAICSVVGAIF